MAPSRKSGGADAEKKMSRVAKTVSTKRKEGAKSNGVVKDPSHRGDEQKGTKPKPTKTKPNSKAEAKEEGSSVCAFPMNRIKVIIRNRGASDSRITQEAIFLINKASEKFIENMCEDSFISDKNYFGYKHISSLVSRERRYDFLSDFVPKRVKAADALAETHAAEP